MLLFRSWTMYLHDAVLVVHPAGIVQCRHWSKEDKRKTMVIEYSKVEKLLLLIARDTTFDIGANDIVSHGYVEFKICYKDGSQKTWSPDLVFGHAHEIMHQVISTYRAYNQKP